MLFELFVLKKPTKKEAEDGARPEIALGPKYLLADSKEEARTELLMSDDVTALKLPASRIEVLIRNFQ